MKLSILIPAYNEEKTIALLLEKVKKIRLPKGWSKEIIVVDDASTDETANKVPKDWVKLIQHKKNMGKGAAIRTAIERAGGEYIVFQDADLEYDPKDIVRLLRVAIEKDKSVVYGSRLLNLKFKLFGKDATPMPFHYWGNKLLTYATNILYGSGLTDMETCYKLFRADVLKSLELATNRFGIEPEITGKLLKAKHEIVEIPIKVKPRGYKDGKKIGWKDAISALRILVLIRFR